MKYALNIGERFRLVQIMPKEADFLTMRDVKDLSDNLLPKPDEEAELGIQRLGDRLTWSLEKAQVEKEIDFTTPQVAVVVAALRKLESDKKVEIQDVSLFEKFEVTKEK